MKELESNVIERKELKTKKSGLVEKNKIVKTIKNNFKNNTQTSGVKKDDDIVGVILRSQSQKLS